MQGALRRSRALLDGDLIWEQTVETRHAWTQAPSSAQNGNHFDTCFPHKVAYGSTKGVESMTVVKNGYRQDGTRIVEHGFLSVALLNMDKNVRVYSHYDSCNVPIRTRSKLSGLKLSSYY